MRVYSIAFAVSLVILMSFSVLLYRSLSSFSNYSYEVEHTQTVLNNIQRVHSAILDAETGQRGFLLTKDSSFLDPMIKATREVPVILDTLQFLTSDNPDQERRVDTLRKAVAARLHHMEEALNRSAHVSEEQLIVLLLDGKEKMIQFTVAIDSLIANERLLFVDRSDKKTESAEITPTYFKLIIAVTLSISLISFLLLYKELIERLEAQKQLEKRFQALNRSNAELRQIAYVTSHDLQEPLRKIRIFSDALVLKSKDNFPDEMIAILNRIDANAVKARELVADLSSFASLSASEEKIVAVDLRAALKKVQINLDSEIKLKNAFLDSKELPIIKGYQSQVQLVFKELISNTLKFARPGVDPLVQITTSIVAGSQIPSVGGTRRYHAIHISDNGIGFEMEYATRIFELFQRLHGQEEGIAGKGFGLSLCQRVMANHDGFITASGKKGEGAVFTLYFPI